MLTLFILLAFSSDCFCLTIDAYYELIRNNQLVRPTLDPKQTLIENNLQNKPSEVKPAPLVFVNTKFTLNKAHYENNLPTLLIEQNQKTYKVLFGEGQIHDQIAKSILNNLGFNISKTSIVENLKLDLGTFDFIELLKFWNRSPMKLSFDHLFESSRTNNRNLVIKTAYIEEVAPAFESLKQKAMRDPQFLLAILWLQCDQIEENSNSLKFCLGNTKAQSSPNLLDSKWVEQGREIGFSLKNFILDDDLRNEAIKLSRSDYVQFYLRTKNLAAEQLKLIFIGYQLPLPLAELYVAKLRMRIINLGFALGLSLAATDEASKVKDAPYIIDGVLVKNYTLFNVEFTQSNFELLLLELIKSKINSIEELAKYVIATFPYTGIEIGQIGETRFTPGFMFRIKREIVENYKATGKNDLYLIKDSIDFLVSFGVGVKMDRKLVSGYVNAGPGYAKNFVLVRPVASLDEAKKTYWSIPKDILWDARFDLLKPNETLAIQSGGLGSAIMGGNIYTGIPKTKPQGYVMDSVQFLNTFQVAKSDQGQTIITTSSDTKNVFSIKLFTKLVTKYIRIPFASFNQVNGAGDQEIFVLNQSQTQLADGLQNNVVLAAMQTMDTAGLKRQFPPASLKTDYNWTNWMLNLYFLETNGASQRTSVEYAQNQAEAKYYTLASSKNSSLNLPQQISKLQNCKFSGVIEKSSSASKLARDSGLLFQCEIEINPLNREYFNQVVNAIAQQLSLSANDFKILKKTLEGQNGESKILLSGSIPHSELDFYLNYSLQTSDVNTIMSVFHLPASFEIKNLSDVAKREASFSMARKLFEVISGPTASARLTTLVKKLSVSNIDDGFKVHILSQMKNLNYKLEVYKVDASELRSTIPVLQGHRFEFSEAMQFLVNRVLYNQKNVFDSL